MTIQEFAGMLHNNQYGSEISAIQELRAKEEGWVVVFGYSDDCVEFRGAINDELGCYNGTTVYLDKKGIFDDPACTCGNSKLAKERAKQIKVVWHDEPGYCWTFETDISHVTFDIVEEDEPYCKGIVFSINDL